MSDKTEHERMLAEAPGKDTAAFHKFLLSKDNINVDLFCFVEGKDYCYYQKRIIEHSGHTPERIMHIPCNCKNSVLSVAELIESQIDPGAPRKSTLFFVDRDYGFDKPLSFVYQTPCYSLENFYTSEECFKKIVAFALQKESHDKNDELCVDLFRDKKREYNKAALDANAILYSIREYENRNCLAKSDFSQIYFNDLVNHASLDAFSAKKISYNIFRNKLGLSFEIPGATIKKNKSMLEQNLHLFRGKNELQFLRWLLRELRKSIKNGTDGFTADEHVHVSENILVDFADYADTPNCLIKYIKKYAVNSSCPQHHPGGCFVKRIITKYIWHKSKT